jgi:hypothetical protein
MFTVLNFDELTEFCEQLIVNNSWEAEIEYYRNLPT